MYTESTYTIRKLGHSLKIGNAWIIGKTTDGPRWPEGNHFWIINTINKQTYHVPVNKRPSWKKYLVQNEI